MRAAPPFGHLRAPVACALAFGVAALVWTLAGGALPGGRWLAVHLFTLGVVSNLVAALAPHFSQTVLHAGEAGAGTGRLVLLNAGALTLVVGLPLGSRWAVAAGATAMTAAVLGLYLALRRMRRSALGSRFGFVVRTYERATSAFVHGALLGALLGTGVLGGAWYASGRLAHLHVNVLGWGGLTFLATVVFFGPTVMRTRIVGGADRVAATALRHGATGLTVGVLALLATGAEGWPQAAARVLAAVGLGVFAAAATAVCLPVLRAAGSARTSPHGLSLAAACAWLPVVLWADVAVVATGRLAWLDTLGAVALAGVLAQAIVASLGYLAPMVWTAGLERRNALRERLDRFAWARVVAFNAGVLAIAAGTRAAPAALARGGWALVALAVLAALALSVPAPGRVTTGG